MPSKAEILGQINAEVAFSPRKITRSRSAHQIAFGAYEANPLDAGARNEFLMHDLAMYHRTAAFGSARLPVDDPRYKFAREVGYNLTDATHGKIDIVTGGGPGAMKAPLEGAYAARREARDGGKKYKIKTHGLTIDLGGTEPPNPFIGRKSHHQLFGTRLQQFADMTRSCIVFDGGIGSGTEFLFILEERQLGRLEPDYPIIIHESWKDFVVGMKKTMYDGPVAKGLKPTINPDDLDIFTIVENNVNDFVDPIVAHYNKCKQAIYDHVKKVT